MLVLVHGKLSYDPSGPEARWEFIHTARIAHSLVYIRLTMGMKNGMEGSFAETVISLSQKGETEEKKKTTERE